MGSAGALSLTFGGEDGRARFQRGVLVLIAAFALLCLLELVTDGLRMIESGLIPLGLALGGRVAVALGASFLVAAPELQLSVVGRGLASRVRRAAYLYPAVPLLALLRPTASNPDSASYSTEIAKVFFFPVAARTIESVFFVVLLLALATILRGLGRASPGYAVTAVAIVVWRLLSNFLPQLSPQAALSSLTFDFQIALADGTTPSLWTTLLWATGQTTRAILRWSVELLVCVGLMRVLRLLRARDLDAAPRER